LIFAALKAIDDRTLASHRLQRGGREADGSRVVRNVFEIGETDGAAEQKRLARNRGIHDGGSLAVSTRSSGSLWR
jgi:hypothetical protein